MTPPRRDPAVRRWLRRPVWWLGASVLILVLLFGSDLAALRHQLRAADGERLEGQILGSWDGGVDVPVSYTPAGGSETVVAIAYAAPGSGRRVGPVGIDVDPRHPTDARLVGADPWQPLIGPLTFIGPAVAALLLWWWARRRRMRRSEALAASEVPSFRMTGMPRPGRISPRRWRMYLYPLDAPAGSAPVCSVAMIDGDDDLRPRTVEVKGQPRPGGEIVVWDLRARRIWWPAGRVLLAGGRPLGAGGSFPVAPPFSPWRWIVPVVAVIVLIMALESGEDEDAARERSDVVLVTVVDGHGDATGPTTVTYRTAAGVEQEATVVLAGPQRPGDRYRMRADPEHPDRLWQPRTSESLPGSAGPVAELVGTLAFIALVVGIVMVRRPRPRTRPWPRDPGLV